MDVDATFFVLGEIASVYPESIERIAHEGHEVACHGLGHRRLVGLHRDAQERLVVQATEAITRTVGTIPRGFRAPGFITDDRLMHTLRASGYIYDSSIVPIRFPGRYDYHRFPRCPFTFVDDSGNPVLVEMPVTVLPLVRLPISLTWMQFLGDRIYMKFFKEGRLPRCVVFYSHSYELSPKTKRDDKFALSERLYHWLKRTLFYRSTGPKLISFLEAFINCMKANGYQPMRLIDAVKQPETVGLEVPIASLSRPSSAQRRFLPL